MLTVNIPAIELYDESRNVFVMTKPQTLVLEHSLVSLSKWESKFCKPFLTKENKTREETLEYYKCMTVTPNVDPDIYKIMSSDVMDLINDYIEAKMTATTFYKREQGSSREVITSEVIYFYMISFNIPFECQKWHLNRLLTLIKVCNNRQQTGKKMTPKELAARNRALNDSRKAKLKTTG